MENKDKLFKIVERIRSFAHERDWEKFHSPKNISMALSVEASELMEHFQWLSEEESRNLSDQKLDEVSQEIADVFLYLLRMSDELGVDLLEVADNKMNLNEKKYPVDKSKGNAKKYTEF